MSSQFDEIREDMKTFHNELEKFYTFFLAQIEKVVDDNRNNMAANNLEVLKTQNKMAVVEHALRDLKLEYSSVQRLREAQQESITGL